MKKSIKSNNEALTRIVTRKLLHYAEAAMDSSYVSIIS